MFKTLARDPFAGVSLRRKPQRLAALAALEHTAAEEALRALLTLQPPAGVAADGFFVARNLQPARRQAILDTVAHRALDDGGVTRLFAVGQLERVAASLTEALAAHHRQQPDSPGLAPALLHKHSAVKVRAPVFNHLLRELIGNGTLQRAGTSLRLAGHEVALRPNEKALWERLRPWLDEGGIHPPKLTDLLARDRTLHRNQVMLVLDKLARFGKIYAVSEEYFVQPQHLHALAQAAQKLARADPHQRLNVKDLRESLGMSRHLSLPLVEFFDQVGFTKRDPEGRKIRRDATDMFGGHPGA